MAFLRSTDEIPSGLSPILLPGEQLVTAVHAHWARLLKPIAISVLVLGIAMFFDANLTHDSQPIGNFLWFVFFVSLIWLGWHILEWRHDWFAATDKRLLLRYGLITHKVAMMPLIKVTDMSYERSIPGKLLGYGRFVMESAGQEQAMRTVEWVRRPDETYRAICAVIFNIGPPSGTTTVREIEEDDTGTGPPVDGGNGPDNGSRAMVAMAAMAAAPMARAVRAAQVVLAAQVALAEMVAMRAPAPRDTARRHTLTSRRSTARSRTVWTSIRAPSRSDGNGAGRRSTRARTSNGADARRTPGPSRSGPATASPTAPTTPATTEPSSDIAPGAGPV